MVTRLGVAYLRGLQNASPDAGAAARPVLGCPKHFAADGGTSWGTTARYHWIQDLWQSDDPQCWRIDQGDSRIEEAQLRAVHLPPYAAAIAAGALSIMVSYSSWNGVKLHANRFLLTDLLKGEMGFDGFLVSDWLALHQLSPHMEETVVTAVNAGLDMVMVPFAYRDFVAAVIQAVENGAISQERIDDAVTRGLRAKLALGLFDRPFGEESWLSDVGSAAHRQVAREAVRKSLVLLKNVDSALPLPHNADRILVAGSAANDIGMQCGGWTIEWQGKPGTITPGVTLLAAITHAVAPDTVVEYEPQGEFEGSIHAGVGIVVVGEPPYSEGEGDRVDLALSVADLALVAHMRRHCDVLITILYSGRPLWIADALAQSDAFVAAWLPGTEADGIADVLFGAHPFTGKLSYTWPLAAEPGGSQFAFGCGLTAS